MPIQEDSKIKESQNEEHLDGSENTKEQNVPKIGKGIINGKYLGGYLALLAIVIAVAQNVFGTDAFTRSACWFCIILILAVLGWGMYLLNKCDSKLRKVNKKINKLSEAKKRKKWIRYRKFFMRIKYIISCIMVLCLVFFSAPVVITNTKVFTHFLADVFDSKQITNKKNYGNENPNVTCSPSPTYTPIPTFSPIPLDESQNNFDILWDTYFKDFADSSYDNVTSAVAKAQNYIDTIWCSDNICPIIDWNFEQMDVYFTESYKECERRENLLKFDQTASQIWTTAECYLIGTKRHIDTKKILQERDFGIASFRGIILFLKYVNKYPDSSEKGRAYNSIAILLRQCGDYLYSQDTIHDKQKQLAMYAFACAFYYKVQQTGSNSFNLADINDMQQSIKDILGTN